MPAGEHGGAGEHRTTSARCKMQRWASAQHDYFFAAFFAAFLAGAFFAAFLAGAFFAAFFGAFAMGNSISWRLSVTRQS